MRRRVGRLFFRLAMSAAADVFQAMVPASGQPFPKLFEDERERAFAAHDDGRADAYARGSRREHLYCVDAGQHSSGPDDGYPDGGGDLVHAAQRDRLQRRPRDAPRPIGQDRGSGLRVHEHAGHRVDGRDPSAPAAATARAMDAMSATFGESFTMQGSDVEAFTCRVTAAAASAEEANITP